MKKMRFKVWDKKGKRKFLEGTKKNIKRETREEIEEVICDILRKDGPDGHIDGYEYIVDFIMALLEKKGGEWIEKYEENKISKMPRM